MSKDSAVKPPLTDAELKLMDEMCAVACNEERLRAYEVESLTTALAVARDAHTLAAARAKDALALCDKLRKGEK